MFITLNIAGQILPLKQATLRRSSSAAELIIQIVGSPSIPGGSSVLMSISDGTTIFGTVSEIVTLAGFTTITASVEVEIGGGLYAPRTVHYRSTGVVRGDIDFSVLPGDTHYGLTINEVTHTIGTSSPAFTEVRF